MNISRRNFVQAGAAALAVPSVAAAWARRDPAPIRIGLVGCGGRGTGAAENCLQSAPDVRLVAMGDLFEDRLASSRKYLAGLGHTVDDDRAFVGWDAYKKVIDSDVDLVLFATPPGFRPQHVRAAIEAGKHVFMEKPVAVDPVGVRHVIETGEMAREKKLGMLAGTQYRHHEQFIETIDRVRDGAIGEILAGRIYYNTGTLWHHGRGDGWTDMEYQVRNWLYFSWLSADHVAEQHIHTIDVCDWAMDARPARCVGMGGRLVRTEEKFGDIYDHFAIDYEYPGGVHVMSMCRQMRGAASHVGAVFTGTQGEAMPYTGTIAGANAWQYKGTVDLGKSYVVEHADLIESIRNGKPLNEARQVAESSLTAIMGRESAYTGQMVTWDDLMKSDLTLARPEPKFGDAPPVSVPKPGSKR